MRHLGLKYVGLFLGVGLLFSQFIACGAQMYQMSLHDDIDEAASTGGGNKRVEFGIHSAAGWQALPIHFKVGRQLDKAQQDGLVAAMKTWETAVGRKLFAFDGVDTRDGDDFTDLRGSLPDFVNGHYLDMNWQKTGKAETVLATTIWQNSAADVNAIDTADIRFNVAKYLIADSLEAMSTDAKVVVDMESLALHELGHLLGLDHVQAKDDDLSVMNPKLFIGEGLITRRLSKGDLQRIQKVYGCQGATCDIESLYASMESSDSKSTTKATH